MVEVVYLYIDNFGTRDVPQRIADRQCGGICYGKGRIIGESAGLATFDLEGIVRETLHTTGDLLVLKSTVNFGAGTEYGVDLVKLPSATIDIVDGHESLSHSNGHDGEYSDTDQHFNDSEATLGRLFYFIHACG